MFIDCLPLLHDAHVLCFFYHASADAHVRALYEHERASHMDWME